MTKIYLIFEADCLDWNAPDYLEEDAGWFESKKDAERYIAHQENHNDLSVREVDKGIIKQKTITILGQTLPYDIYVTLCSKIADQKRADLFLSENSLVKVTDAELLKEWKNTNG